MTAFEEFGLSKELLTAIKKLGFVEPTEVQILSIPHILAGEDVLAESATGSGKTLAFGCGIIDRVVERQGLQALILTPTRELAEQVKDSLIGFLDKRPLRIISVYGGVSFDQQVRALTKAEVVVATPGRFLDHLNRRTIKVSNIRYLVIDEADRMFDMGFIDDVEKIIKVCPNNRQTMLFSATLSSEIKRLAHRYMREPREVSAVSQVDPSKLKQEYYNVPHNLKLSLLVHFLKYEKTGLVMVFCNTRKTTDFVVKNLSTNGIRVMAIHGGLSQNKRTNTLSSFNQARTNILVCTDVAARGLHIDNVTHIYNYEIPRDPINYVHRIGRTARAGKEGKAINFLSNYDHDSFSKILREYREFSIEKMSLPQIATVEVVRESFRPQRREAPRYRRR